MCVCTCVCVGVSAPDAFAASLNAVQRVAEDTRQEVIAMVDSRFFTVWYDDERLLVKGQPPPNYTASSLVN